MKYYNKDTPSIGDIVIAKITKVDELGVELEFLEYNNQRGYILQSNLQRVKKNQFNQIYKIGNDLHVEYVGIFEKIMSFTNKSIDEEKVKEFNKNFKNYKKIINIISNFLEKNKGINQEYFLNKVLYNYLKNEDDEDNEENNHTIIIRLYNKIIKEDEMVFELDKSVKTKYYEYIKENIQDTKCKGSLKYESFSANSNGLNEIKSFYLDVIKYSRENEIELIVTLESTPRYLITFKEEKYIEELIKKIELIEEYIKTKEVKFFHNLILKSCIEE